MIEVPAFVLANLELGEEEEVKKKVLEIPGVEEAYRVFGVYDLVIKLKTEDKEEIRKIIFRRIRRIKGVRSTMTLMTAE